MAITTLLKDVLTSRLLGKWSVLRERKAVDERILFDLDQLTLLNWSGSTPEDYRVQVGNDQLPLHLETCLFLL